MVCQKALQSFSISHKYMSFQLFYYIAVLISLQFQMKLDLLSHFYEIIMLIIYIQNELSIKFFLIVIKNNWLMLILKDLLNISFDKSNVN
jgi:hypothetical protein